MTLWIPPRKLGSVATARLNAGMLLALSRVEQETGWGALKRGNSRLCVDGTAEPFHLGKPERPVSRTAVAAMHGFTAEAAEEQ